MARWWGGLRKSPFPLGAVQSMEIRGRPLHHCLATSITKYLEVPKMARGELCNNVSTGLRLPSLRRAIESLRLCALFADPEHPAYLRARFAAER